VTPESPRYRRRRELVDAYNEMSDARADSLEGFLASAPVQQILSRQGFLP